MLSSKSYKISVLFFFTKNSITTSDKLQKFKLDPAVSTKIELDHVTIITNRRVQLVEPCLSTLGKAPFPPTSDGDTVRENKSPTFKNKTSNKRLYGRLFVDTAKQISLMVTGSFPMW